MAPGKPTRGFTLLELILTILILSALVALAVPYYQSYLEDSKRAVMIANLQTIRKTLIEYKSDTGTYPISLTDLMPKYFFELPEDPINATNT
ncbi:MAG TPA: prepilin-type N-terminal cleavage/methylation domain-containing protein [Candidatus Ozemobacteraceae bacterium]|nr:prepilin-type N-terminal cleavage/methylation domain-containing protein [Candidatus Ozemobacteraceae bacterium]